jgi:serine/threonine protein phosphatase PrpC
MTVARTALWGEDHPELGQHAIETLGDDSAIGLSAGRLPKAYWHRDRNEDAALAVAAGDRRLLAVADGHNGANAARVALTAIADAAADSLDSKKPGDALAVLLRVAADAVTAHLAAVGPPRDESRCALSLALVAEGRVLAATWGDTTAARVRTAKRNGVKQLTAPTAFLGPDATLPPIATGKVKPGDAVIVCSDGITDFLGGRWREQLLDSVRQGQEAADVARDLIERAALGGAGDHLSVAVHLT